MILSNPDSYGCLQGCFMCCYLICPPTPNSITRKIAFHPPQKGRTYAVYLEDGKCVSNASKVGFLSPFSETSSENSKLKTSRIGSPIQAFTEMLTMCFSIINIHNPKDLCRVFQFKTKQNEPAMGVIAVVDKMSSVRSTRVIRTHLFANYFPRRPVNAAFIP